MRHYHPWYTGVWISGSEFLPDGRLILCLTGSHAIKLLDRWMDVKYTLSLDTSLWDVAVINSSVAVVT